MACFSMVLGVGQPSVLSKACRQAARSSRAGSSPQACAAGSVGAQALSQVRPHLPHQPNDLLAAGAHILVKLLHACLSTGREQAMVT